MKKDLQKFPQVATSHDFALRLMKKANWFSGVPDSVFKKVIPLLRPYFNATRENHSLAMAFGAVLSGKKPAILIQNSGLGLLIDTLIGLHQLYGMGVLLVVSHRGELNWEEVQHHLWGKKSLSLLELCDISVFDLQKIGLDAIDKAADLAFHNHKVTALIVHRGNLDE